MPPTTQSPNILNSDKPACASGIKHEADIKNIQKSLVELKVDFHAENIRQWDMMKEIVDKLDKIRNRPAVYIFILFSVLTAILGYLVKTAS